MLYLFDCLIVKSCSIINYRVCGAMDNASDYGSEDSRFESWQTRRKYPFLERTHTWIWIVCENGILGFWIELFYCGGDRWTKGPCPLLYWKLPKKYTPPRRGIEPRSPAWQAGILTTILPRSYLLQIEMRISRYRIADCLRNVIGISVPDYLDALVYWSHGVMVSTLDSESSDPSSNLGGTCASFVHVNIIFVWPQKRTCTYTDNTHFYSYFLPEYHHISSQFLLLRISRISIHKDFVYRMLLLAILKCYIVAHADKILIVH